MRNLAERGLDFADIVSFDWETALTFVDARRDYGELRRLSLGYLRQSIVVVVYIYRDDACRIISIRKANRREQHRYEQWNTTTSPRG